MYVCKLYLIFPVLSFGSLPLENLITVSSAVIATVDLVKLVLGVRVYVSIFVKVVKSPCLKLVLLQEG